MKYALWFISVFALVLLLKGADISVNCFSAKGTCLPSANVTIRLSLHGIDQVDVWANGNSLGNIKFPYDCTFPSLSLGNTNTLVVVTQDYLRRTTTNTFEIVSRAPTYNKRFR